MLGRLASVTSWLSSTADAQKETRTPSSPQAAGPSSVPALSRNQSHLASPTANGQTDLPLPINGMSSPKVSKKAKFGNQEAFPLRVHWDKFKRRLGPGAPPSVSSMLDSSVADTEVSRRANNQHEQEKDVAEIQFGDPVRIPNLKSQRSDNQTDPERGDHSVGNAPTSDDIISFSHGDFWSPSVMLRFTRWQAILGFFRTRFIDDKAELDFIKEEWYLKKPLALWASVFLVINWALSVIFVTRNTPFLLFDEVFIFGLAPIFTFPIPFLVIFDFPRDRNVIYQFFLFLASWCWGVYIILTIFLCGNYDPSFSKISCGNKDFTGAFYFIYALPTVAMFGLRLQRFPVLVGALIVFLLSVITIAPVKTTWIRHMINYAVFTVFILYLSHSAEKAQRHVYYLRDQLKTQFKATQKAQINEVKASESKRRLTSYVFHEVRVPLNTALLAVQNLQASGATLINGQELEFTALEGSLSMMSQVLNDVLDFNRMDSGRFESLARPYSFHQTMRSMFIPIQLATGARQMQFEADLDPAIDEVARRAAYEAIGEPAEKVECHMRENPNVEGVVVGDETRLRQVITNLASNACKFTPPGGKLTIRTKLIYPTSMAISHLETDNSSTTIAAPERQNSDDSQLHTLSTRHLKQHDKSPLEWIVVRIEISDTGCGIKQEDMVMGKLFSPFTQTELGRQQGGKGSGLGLALVRQIVKLSGGRLGVRSKVGEDSGSTFWVELPLGVGAKALLPVSPAVLAPTPPLDTPDSSTENKRILQRPLLNPMQAHDEESSLRSSQGGHMSARSAQAVKSIMDQAGRVELKLSANDITTQKLAADGVGTSPVLNGAHSSSSSLELPRNGRPTHVTLPERTPFMPPNDQSTSAPLQTTSTDASSPGSIRLSPTAQKKEIFGPKPSPNPLFSPPLNVLVVDDDNLTRVLMNRLLTRLGCNVSSAENGELALDMILSAPRPYDVVFLDNRMPVLSGVAAVERLRDDFKRTDFVVGLTGNALLSDQNEYLEAGVDRVLTKPVLERHLIEVLHTAHQKKLQSTSTG